MNAPIPPESAPDTAPDSTLLGAWLDQQLPADERRRVDAWLQHHPEDAAKVRGWAADRDTLREVWDPVQQEPVPIRLQQAVWRRRGGREGRAWPRGAALAAGVAVFALGAIVGAATAWRWAASERVLAQQASSAWVQRAAIAHSVYTPEVRHPVEVAVAGAAPAEAQAQELHLSRWLTKRLALPVRTFDLRAQGYELVGGRLLPDNAGPSAQLMYQRPGEPATQRVTVYLRAPDANTPAAFRYEQQGDLGLFYWVEAGVGYALVGAQPREQLLALAEAVDRQIRLPEAAPVLAPNAASAAR
jgi:anti-sigma factor RsiW